MGDNDEFGWVLCPSTRFPGRLYYFNTKTGEKAWSWSDSMNKSVESRASLPTSTSKDNFTGISQEKDSQIPNNSDSSRQCEQFLMGSSELSSPMNDTNINNTSLRYIQTLNNLSSRQSEQLPMESRGFWSQTTENYINNNTQKACKMTNNLSSRQNDQLPMEFRTFTSPTTDKFKNTQTVCKPRDNSVLWSQPRELSTSSRDSPMSESDVFIDIAQYACKITNNPSNRQINQSQAESRHPTINKKIINTQVENNLVSNYSFSWKVPQEQCNQCKELTLPINNKFIGNTPNSMSLISNNSFSFGQQKYFQNNSRNSLTNNCDLKRNLQASYRLSPNSLTQHKPILSKKYGLRTLKGTYKPMKNNPFTKLFLKPLKTKSDVLGQPIGRSLINTNLAVQFNSHYRENAESSRVQNNKMDNVELIDVMYLRNLSKSNFIKEWFIIPDVDVLLEDFDFLKKFIAEDPACKLMIPEIVIKKLQTFSDSRATVAKQIVQWLTIHAVCELNNKDQYLLTNVTIYEKLIKFCVESKIHHVVFITKEEHLHDAAKINGVHTYYLSELNLREKTNHIQENLFLQNTDNFDRFLISNSVQKSNNSTNNINENNNNTMIKKSNLPVTASSKLEKGGNTNKNSFENIIIQCHATGDRTIMYNQNIDNSSQLVRDSSNDYLESNTIQQSIQSENNIEVNVDTVAKQINNFETNDRTRFRFGWNNTQIEANHIENNIFNAGVDSDSCSDLMSKTYVDYEKMEEELKDFCTKHSHLQDFINDSRVDEWSCCFVQIIEQFLDDIFQGSTVKKFAPPHYFQQGLKCLRDFYSQNIHICSVIDKLIGLCGYRLINGVVRTNIKTEHFLKILGAGCLLIERIDEVSQLTEICKYYKDMLCNLIATIQASEPEDFSDTISISLEMNLRIEEKSINYGNGERQEAQMITRTQRKKK